MVSVLVVDDEVALADMVAAYLDRAGFETALAHDGQTALDTARERTPDVVILDVGLPRLDGIEVCRQLRSFSDCYVIFLTARDDEVDRLLGLAVGGDDYVTKPFSVREVVARVQAVLRRPRTAAAVGADEPVPYRVGSVEIDLAGRVVTVAGEVVELTRTEFDILALLVSKPSYAWSRQRILDEVWGPGWVGDDHLVDVHVANLRRKVGDSEIVRTVRGVGYRIAS